MKRKIILTLALLLTVFCISVVAQRLKAHGALVYITTAGQINLTPASGQGVSVNGPSNTTGNATFAGTLASTGNFTVGASKLTVTAASGNTAVAGTFGVTGASTLTGGVSVSARNVPYATKTVLTPAAAITLDSTLGDFFTLVPDQATTLNATVVGVQGQRLFLKILTSGTSSFTITFGTNFKSTGTLATGTADAKTFMISFISDGTNYIETSRTAAQ